MNYCRFNDKCITLGQMNLIFRARLLWRNTATWTRSYLASAYAGVDTQEVSNKLYNSNLEYGNVLKLFFGDKITDDYINLLNDYVRIYQAYFQALMEGDQAKAEMFQKQLYENIDKRAANLANVNPFWQEVELKNLLYTFTELLIDEAKTFISQDYHKNVDIFDRLLSHSTTIGDYFSEGLLNFLNYSAR